MRLAMEGAFDTAAAPALAASSPSRGRLPMVAVAVAALAIVALAVPAVRHLLETPPPAPPETRLEIGTPGTNDAESFALSPDGRQVVYQVSVGGGVRLWLRSLAQTTPIPLAGTDGARQPFWSPDGRSIGFFADGAIKRLDLGGGSPRTLAPAIGARGATWGVDGSILFAPGVSPLMRISATGGKAAQVTTLGPAQSGHASPSFLPDGRRFVFSILGVPAETGIYLGSLDGGVPVLLTLAGGAGKYLPAAAPDQGGWLLWVQARALVAQRLDVEKGALVGEPVTVADEAANISAVPPGLVAYSGADGGRQLTWVDRTGAARGTIGDPDGSLAFPRVSPDGRRVAASRSVQGNRDIWLFDGTRASRLTFDPGGAEVPLWSPDGTRIVYRSRRTGNMDLYQTLATGGREESLVASDQTKAATSWSRDGRFVLYMSNDARSYSDLWVVPTTGDRTPSVVLKAPFREAYGAFSPDGRWVAYHSNESGRNEIYVRPFVAPGSTSGPAGGQWQVSAAGGVHPVWRHDGKELYYLSPTGAMMAVPIAVSGTAVAPGEPVLLFSTRIYLGGLDEQGGRQYDVAPDGRFLINMVLEEATSPITLIQNWNPGAKK